MIIMRSVKRSFVILKLRSILTWAYGFVSPRCNLLEAGMDSNSDSLSILAARL